MTEATILLLRSETTSWLSFTLGDCTISIRKGRSLLRIDTAHFYAYRTLSYQMNCTILPNCLDSKENVQYVRVFWTGKIRREKKKLHLQKEV